MEINNDAGNCPSVFLTDKPSDSDAFGPHGRLAETIFDMISTEQDGRAIALLGSWGSGKSTVIRLIDKEATDNTSQDIKLITFDAWEHETDSLRRSFIDHLTLTLEGSAWAKSGKWKNLRLLISRRKRTQEIKTTPRLTPLGGILAMMSLFVPLGLVLFSKIGTKDFPYLWSVLGLIIAALPFLTVLFNVIRIKYKNQTIKVDAINEVFALLVNKQETTVRSSTIETPEPTSIEFQKYFREILYEVLENYPRRKLVLVIDNLDRVNNKEDIMNIWSTMRTFLEGQADVGTWRNRVWLIVPFDVDELQANVNQNNRIKSLVDRTFQARFHVPQPVLSRWYAHITTLLSEAMPYHHNVDEFHDVYRIYLSFHHNESITPRGIRVFINQLVTIHRQWGDTIPLSDQAIHILCQMSQTSLQNILEASKSKTMPDSLKRVVEYGTKELYSNLIAMHLNVEPKEAMQEILKSELEIAIQNNSEDRVKEWSSAPGFWEACEFVFQDMQERVVHHPSILLNGARILDGLGDADGTKSWSNCWKTVLKVALSVEGWKTAGNNSGHGLVSILKHTESEEDWINLLQAFNKDLEHQSTWITEVEVILDFLLMKNKENLITSNLSAPIDATQYVELYVQNQTCRKLFKWVPPRATGDDFTNLFKSMITNGQIQTNHLDVYELLVGVQHLSIDDRDFPNLVSTRIQSTQTLTQGELGGLLTILLKLKERNESSIQILQNLSLSGFLHHHLGQIQNGESSEIAIVIFILLEYLMSDSLISNNNSLWSAMSGVNYINSFANNPNDYKAQLDNLLIIIEKHSGRRSPLDWSLKSDVKSKLGNALLNRVVESGTATNWLTYIEVIEYYERMSNIMSEDMLYTLVRQFAENDQFLSSLEQTPIASENVKLFGVVLSCNQRVQTTLINIISINLKKLDSKSWENSLMQDDGYMRIVKLITDQNNNVLEFETPVEDALRNQATTSRINVNSMILYGALSQDGKKRLVKDFRDILISSDSPVANIIESYGEEIIKYGELASRTDDLVRSGFRRFLDRGDPIEVTWMSKVLDGNPDIYHKCPPETWKGFISRLNNARSEATNETLTFILDKILKPLKERHYELAATSENQEK